MEFNHYHGIVIQPELDWTKKTKTKSSQSHSESNKRQQEHCNNRHVATTALKEAEEEEQQLATESFEVATLGLQQQGSL